jgi:hypothetical protein
VKAGALERLRNLISTSKLRPRAALLAKNTIMVPLYAIGKLEAQAIDNTVAMLKNDFATVVAIASFNAVAWYIAIELNTQLFFTFKRYRGLYFWSVWISSWGVILEPLGKCSTCTDGN